MFNNIIKNISKSIVGNEDRIKLTLAAIISEGSILIAVSYTHLRAHET